MPDVFLIPKGKIEAEDQHRKEQGDEQLRQHMHRKGISLKHQKGFLDFIDFLVINQPAAMPAVVETSVNRLSFGAMHLS